MKHRRLYAVAATSTILGVAAWFLARRISAAFPSGRWYLAAGILLVLVSAFFIRKSIVDTTLSRTNRLVILLGPCLAGGVTGLASIGLALAPTYSSSIVLWLSIVGAVSFQAAVVVAVLSAARHRRAEDPTKREPG